MNTILNFKNNKYYYIYIFHIYTHNIILDMYIINQFKIVYLSIFIYIFDVFNIFLNE